MGDFHKLLRITDKRKFRTFFIFREEKERIREGGERQRIMEGDARQN